MKLYEIQKVYTDALSLVDEDGVLTDEALDMIDKSESALEVKAENIAKVLQTFDNNEQAIKNEIDRLNKLKKSINSNRASLKKYIAHTMQSLNRDKIETELFKISFRKSETVEVLDQDIVPKEYIKEKVTYAVDKTEIKKALKNGEIIEGVELKENKNLQIK